MRKKPFVVCLMDGMGIEDGKSFEIYNKYTLKDEDKREFNIPKYNFLKGAN